MSLERVLSAVRALVARELVERGLSVNETARLLGLTPAAVSMYISGKRGREYVEQLERDERIMSLIKSQGEMLYDMALKGERGLVDLTELAKVVLNIISQKPPGVELEEAIRERIRLEQETASRAMAYSYKSKNPLARALFMQIASDSLRHAEILAAILDYIGGRLKAEELGITAEELEALGEEERSMRESIVELYKLNDPIIRALLLSIELDEQKHYQLVKAIQLAVRPKGSG